MNELIAKIEQWAEDRNIIKGSKPIDQAMKLFSEFGELADNVGKGRDCRDDIGDCAVVLIIMCKQLNKPIRVTGVEYLTATLQSGNTSPKSIVAS
ncbi:MAG: MazG-like family protein, partial [Leuconostoc falkenbergense]|uniref:MazG-like family protein n=1 Tax=Leuconostoc falkenbergense TaxID=2766470 RepID=UPI003BB60816